MKTPKTRGSSAIGLIVVVAGGIGVLGFLAANSEFGSQLSRPEVASADPASESWSPTETYSESVDPYENYKNWVASGGLERVNSISRPEGRYGIAGTGTLSELKQKWQDAYEIYIREQTNESYLRCVAAQDAYNNALRVEAEKAQREGRMPIPQPAH